MAELEISRLTKFFGGLRAVSDFDLSLQQGELVGLIGPNGAGKTTVFNLITGLLTPTSGTIEYRGQSLVGLQPHRVFRQGVARTFQNIRLFQNATVLDNVLVALDANAGYSLLAAAARARSYHTGERQAHKRAYEVLELLGLRDRVWELAMNLPYGAQRRLEIARALASAPKLLLLDEPAAGMNPAEVNELVTLIREIRTEFGLTVLLIEHQMGLVMNLCERVVVMDFGEVIAGGPAAAVQRDPKVLEAYLGRRAGAKCF